MQIFQQTLVKSISYTGIGLHSGQDVTITLKPAEINTGIVFSRIDLPGAPRVAAKIENVTNTLRATTLEAGSAKVFTVEHLLAAFSAIGVDNCLIEINSVEPPVADGSALAFIKLIQEAGVKAQEASRKIIKIKATYAIYDEDKYIIIKPYNGYRVSFTSINSHPKLGTQFGDYLIDEATFIKELAAARTIGFLHEVEALQANGLALGGSLENAIVYDHEKALTPLRFEDELVRHKILDVVGDLSLLGPIEGHVIALKSSHALNTTLAKKIFDEFI